MQALLAAIVAKFQATPALVTAFPGGIWPGRADESAAVAGYIGYTLIAGPTMESYGNLKPYTAVIQFDFFTRDPNAIGTKAALFTAAFDAAVLTLGSGSHTGTRRNGEPMPGPDLTDDRDEKKGHGVRGQAHWLCVYEFDVDPRT